MGASEVPDLVASRTTAKTTNVIQFSISCDTCAAKLKVTHASAIGQSLACPKCGSMVRVPAPPGWKPPEPEVAEAPDEWSLADLSSGHFDDIEGVLSQQNPLAQQKPATRTPVRQNVASPNPAARPPSTPASSNPASSTPRARPDSVQPEPAKPAQSSLPTTAPKPPKRSHGASTENDASPILPDGQWVSPETQARKKKLLIAGLVLGALIIAGTTITAWMANTGNSAADVADPADTDVNPDGNADSGNNSSDETDKSGDENKHDEVENQHPDEDETVEETENANPLIVDSTQTPENESSDEANDSAGVDTNQTSENQSESDEMTTEQESTDQNPLVTNPLDRNPLAETGGILDGAITPGISGPGQLSSILQEANSSILEIQNLADSIRDTEISGTPKYYLEKPDSKPADVTRQLGLICPGMECKDKPVIVFLREISAITGLTIDVDVASWQAAGIPLNAKIDLHIENQDFGTTIDGVLADLKLVKLITPDGMIVVEAANAVTQSESEYTLPAIANPTPERRANQINAIKQLVDPTSWLTETHAATLQINGNKVSVKQNLHGHWQMRELFNKVAAAKQLVAGLADARSKNTLQTPWTSAAGSIDAEMPVTPSYPTRIESLLTRIHQRSGVSILVDWRSATRAGWTPATIVPGNFAESTPIAAAQELAVAMDLTVRVIDSKTLQLTTFDSAAKTNELEIFYCGDILKGPLTEELLSELINQTIGPRLNSTPGVRVDYDPELKSIISLAPQPLQQQLEAILKRLAAL